MLNKRQTEILLEFYEHPEESFAASYFAEKKGAGLRTIQMDFKAIKEELDKDGFASLEAKRGKGSYLVILNQENFSYYVNNLYLQYNCDELSYPLNRVNRIIFRLLQSFRPVPLHRLESDLFISRSTLASDLKSAQDSLQKYSLQLLRESNEVRIVGQETDKRRCLAENSLYLAHVQGVADEESCINMQRISWLKDVLVSSFLENQYCIAETDMSNAILELNIALHRIQKRFFIQADEFEASGDIERELKISTRIFTLLRERFLCRIPQEEVEYFAIYLKGQESCKGSDIISQEMDAFILKAFEGIKKVYGIDFTNNIDLRIAIALHSIPLAVRVRYDMQIHDRGLANIKQTFPLGYEIASYYAFRFREMCGGRLAEDEISLLAAHFYSSILEMKRKSQSTRVLVISSLKRSLTVLLRATLTKWFSQEIAALEICEAEEVTEDALDSYDVFLTTDKNIFYEKGLAMLISTFPTDNDRRNIKLLLDGFKGLDDVVQIFQRDLFMSIEQGEKEEILEALSKKGGERYALPELYDEVKRREGIGSTFFGEGIAIPHPMQALSSDTFVAVCVSRRPILWDEDGHKVQVVIMVHIGKNNPRSFQLWDYLASILEDKSWAAKTALTPTFDGFIERVRSIWSKKFSEG